MNAAWRPANGDDFGPTRATWPPHGTMNSWEGLAGICSERRAMTSIGLVGEVGDVLGRPVVAVAGWVVERALKVGVGGGLEEIGCRWSEGANRPQGVLAGLDGSGVHAGDDHGRLPVEGVGNLRLGGRGDEGEGESEFVGRVEHDVAEQAKELAPALGGVQHEAGEHLAGQGMQPELERGHDPEVAASASQGPQQFRVLVGAGADQVAVGSDEFGRQQVVARQPVLALQPTRAAAQREPGHAGAGDAAAGGGESEALTGPVDIAPGRTPADTGDASLTVDFDVAEVAHVEDEAAVAQRTARHRVPAGPDRDLEALLTGPPERGDHVVRVRTAGDEQRSMFDHRVEQRARVRVLGLAGLVEPAPEAGTQLLDRPAERGPHRIAPRRFGAGLPGPLRIVSTIDRARVACIRPIVLTCQA